MHFVSWLWEQMDYQDANSRFAKVCWDDVNNGCALPTFSAQQWHKHFDEKHKNSKEKLNTMLIRAYDEYMLFMNGK